MSMRLSQLDRDTYRIPGRVLLVIGACVGRGGYPTACAGRVLGTCVGRGGYPAAGAGRVLGTCVGRGGYPATGAGRIGKLGVGRAGYAGRLYASRATVGLLLVLYWDGRAGTERNAVLGVAEPPP